MANNLIIILKLWICSFFISIWGSELMIIVLRTVVYENINIWCFQMLGCSFHSISTLPAMCLFDDTCFEGTTFSGDVLHNAFQEFTAATVHPHKPTPLKVCDSYQPVPEPLLLDHASRTSFLGTLRLLIPSPNNRVCFPWMSLSPSK